MIAVTFENSTYCGADCTTCVRKEMQNVNQNMPDDLFCSIIDQLKDWNKGRIEAISFVGNGDPLMDAHVIEKFRYIKEHTSFKIHLTNTCHMLKGNILDACENLLIGDLKVQTWQDIVEGDELKRIARLHDCLDFEACGICADCDLTYDRTDALIYTSNPNKKVGMKAGYEFNAVDFTKKM